MQFGAFVPQGWRITLAGIDVDQHWPTMLGVAKDIERLGFQSAWVYDHFHTVPEPTQEVTYEAWTMMAALATTTDTIRLGQMCTCNTYRPPSYLAKVAACIDVISGGRLEMGIGAGWYEHEHDGYGYQFLPPGGRLGMLREGVEIMKAMWTEDEVTYDGDHYNLKGAICQPKPAQEPHIPFWIAGGGEKVTLNIAARHGQYTNFGGDSLDTFVHKSEVLKGHCDDVGTDFDTIVRSANFNVLCAPSEAEVEEKISWLEGHLGRYVSAASAKRSAGLFKGTSGTPEQIVSWLEDYQKAGMGYAIIQFADVAYDRESLSLFADEVMPALT
jgi:F420-dependent oxidoreductase-like protein